MNTINRMSRGAAVMGRGVKPLLWAGEWSETLARWFVLAVIASLLLTSVALHAWVFYVVAGAALLAAYQLGATPGEAEVADDESGAQEGEESPEEGKEGEEQEPYSPDEVLELLWDLKAHERGALLSQIREQLQSETGAVWGPREVRALLDSADIPVRDGVRVRGVGNSTGVHRDDVPPPSGSPSQSAPVDVVDAGQATNANTNNGATARIMEDGAVAISTPDPDRPHHTIVRIIPAEGVTKA